MKQNVKNTDLKTVPFKRNLNYFLLNFKFYPNCYHLTFPFTFVEHVLAAAKEFSTINNCSDPEGESSYTVVWAVYKGLYFSNVIHSHNTQFLYGSIHFF